MSPQTTIEPRPLSQHPQRPWRPVGSEPRRPSRSVTRTFRTPVVRELPRRAERRAPAGTW
jgi:hypothetical protein